MSAADPGRRRGRAAAEAEAVLRATESSVQEEDAASTPQLGAGSAPRGTAHTLYSAFDNSLTMGTIIPFFIKRHQQQVGFSFQRPIPITYLEMKDWWTNNNQFDSLCEGIFSVINYE